MRREEMMNRQLDRILYGFAGIETQLRLLERKRVMLEARAVKAKTWKEFREICRKLDDNTDDYMEFLYYEDEKFRQMRRLYNDTVNGRNND